MIRYEILEPDEIESIHEATLRILSEVGIVLAYPPAIDLLAGAGATIQDDRVRLPPDLVEREVGRCPGRVPVRGRNGSEIILGDGQLYWHNLGGARDVYEYQTGKKRPAVIQDICDSTRLMDALNGSTSITPLFTPTDVPGPLMSLAMYRHALPHTTKPVQGPGVLTITEVDLAVKMASVIGPPPEVLTLSVSPISPLTFSDNIAGSIMEVARRGVGFGPLPCPSAGTTAPLSLAGALAQQNAEVLASIVLAQLVHPGLPIIYCGRLAMVEPRTVTSVWGGVELGIASAATVQIGHRYGLPVNVYGFSSNAHTLDFQSGYERALNAVIPAIAGADELSGIGEMEAGITSSYAQIVADDEIASSVRRIRRGFKVDQDSLAVDLIATVMDGSHNFIDQMHTVRYLRAGEIFIPKLAERQSWDEWEQAGRVNMADRAEARARELLEQHQVPPLDKGQEQELDAIMEEAAKKLN